jgi:hypothetical protein
MTPLVTPAFKVSCFTAAPTPVTQLVKNACIKNFDTQINEFTHETITEQVSKTTLQIPDHTSDQTCPSELGDLTKMNIAQDPVKAFITSSEIDQSLVHTASPVVGDESASDNGIHHASDKSDYRTVSEVVEKIATQDAVKSTEPLSDTRQLLPSSSSSALHSEMCAGHLLLSKVVSDDFLKSTELPSKIHQPASSSISKAEMSSSNETDSSCPPACLAVEKNLETKLPEDADVLPTEPPTADSDPIIQGEKSQKQENDLYKNIAGVLISKSPTAYSVSAIEEKSNQLKNEFYDCGDVKGANSGTCNEDSKLCGSWLPKQDLDNAQEKFSESQHDNDDKSGSVPTDYSSLSSGVAQCPASEDVRVLQTMENRNIKSPTCVSKSEQSVVGPAQSVLGTVNTPPTQGFTNPTISSGICPVTEVADVAVSGENGGRESACFSPRLSQQDCSISRHSSQQISVPVASEPAQKPTALNSTTSVCPETEDVSVVVEQKSDAESPLCLSSLVLKVENSVVGPSSASQVSGISCTKYVRTPTCSETPKGLASVGFSVHASSAPAWSSGTSPPCAEDASGLDVSGKYGNEPPVSLSTGVPNSEDLVTEPARSTVVLKAFLSQQACTTPNPAPATPRHDSVHVLCPATENVRELLSREESPVCPSPVMCKSAASLIGPSPPHPNSTCKTALRTPVCTEAPVVCPDSDPFPDHDLYLDETLYTSFTSKPGDDEELFYTPSSA